MKPRGTGVALLAAWLFFGVGSAIAVCVCGYGDGFFTTHTNIVIDGSMVDWATVLLDTDNTSCDGATPNVPPQPDRDAPVQSTGRDLSQFTYTWNGTHVQTQTVRAASSTNVQRFIYYADLDNDGFMETGERVIVAGWKGSNRNVELYLGHYVASAPAGDPMVDTNGFADGYTLPGRVPDLPSAGQPHYSGNWGSLDGVSMEWRVSWADAPGAPGLGVAPGSAFTFHVSSTNSNPGAASFPDQVDDNMAGCGGGAATTQYAQLDFFPDRSLVTTAGSVVHAAHRVANLGNGNDLFDLTAGTPSGAHSPTMTFLRDVDRSGTWTAGDLALVNTGGGSAVDTGTMAPGDTLWVLIRYTVAGGATGTATIVSTARSGFNPNRTNIVTDTVAITQLPKLLVTKSSQTIYDPVAGVSATAKAIPDARVDYTIRIENEGTGSADANTVTITDPLPATTRLYVGNLGGIGSGPVAFTDGSPVSGLVYIFISLASPVDNVAFSNDGGATFTYTPSPDIEGFDESVTHLRISFLGSMNAAAGGNPWARVRFRVAVR
ncbi:MAG: hypothetical protein SGI90_06750 [Candidatus Eisenbacteria bacterium]|nr:hypothetical protein [Candidatus Eisenbacteria bacterium]